MVISIQGYMEIALVNICERVKVMVLNLPFEQIYKILADLWDRKRRRERLQKERLSDYLYAIVRLLDDAQEKFQRWQVPTREGNELALLFSFAEQLAVEFKDEHKELVEIFERQIPNVRCLMNQMDMFIREEEGEYRWKDSAPSDEAPYTVPDD